MKLATVITGVGCVTPLGNSADDFCREIASMISGNISTDTDRNHIKELRVKDFIFDDRELLEKYPRLDRGCQYILQAAAEAIKSSNLTPEIINNYRVGVIIGSTVGMFDSQEKFLRMLYRTGKGSPMYFQQTANNLPSGIISYKYRIDGINLTLYNGWTVGLDAVILANQLIRSDQVDIIIAGGVDILNETIISQYTYYQTKKSFLNCFLPGEGAGILILESEELALRRKQRIKGRLVVSKQTSLLNEREIKHELISIISNLKFSFYFSNLNGTIFDTYEREVIESIKPNVVILKNLMGECGAASGVLQAIYALYLDGESIVISVGIGQVNCLKIQKKGGGFNE